MLQKYKIELSYDGTNYCGWQMQPNALSIQEVVEEKISQLTSQKIRVVSAGRTDAGVHALAQTAHFTAALPFSLSRFMIAINALLPKEIRINSIEIAPPTFHAQYSAKSKIYHYHLWLEKRDDPFLYPYRHKPKLSINVGLLQAAIPYFVGKHDFTTFANVNGVENKIRTLFRLDSIPQEGGLRLEFEGDGFLYKMVRNIVGTLLEVGAGKLPPLAFLPFLQRKTDNAHR